MADERPILPIETILSKWTTVAIDKWQEELTRQDIGEIDGDLMRSFTREIINAGGDAWTVLIKFLKHGRFVDMGVGRGHPLGTSTAITSKNGNRYQKEGTRKPKKWYSKIKTREIAILRFILAKNFCLLSLKTLEQQLKAIK